MGTKATGLQEAVLKTPVLKPTAMALEKSRMSPPAPDGTSSM